jgi:hypothetical protein
MDTLPSTTCRVCAGRKMLGDRDDIPTRLRG